MKKKVAVLGAGSWGTTLSILLSKKSLEVKLWAKDENKALSLRKERENKYYLPGIKIPQNIFISSSIEEVIKDADIIVIAVPTHVVREITRRAFSNINRSDIIIVNASKGIENNTLNRMSEVIFKETGNENIVVLSGPSHAEEVSLEIPTAIVAASNKLNIAKEVQELFFTSYFRVYTNLDLIGVEIGGALKNIIAIGTGILDGLKLGDNTKAALITRGLAEITRFGTFFGAKKETFAGLSGIGDLVCTCTSKHSRNRLLGEKIGYGKKLKEALEEMIMVAEGLKTTLSVYDMAKKNNINMPITEQMYEVLYCDKSPEEALYKLMNREARYEIDEEHLLK
ncbi:MAG: NAD(P)H-dependent glycerol-3-phosphate dehydrogenase [Candidatus Firestonebacteria bacterium]|nr:NAD(P)H-dependent glycerol-3-phosphate dehydrogenase [Candidatus Firestonebacteria bacterium]